MALLRDRVHAGMILAKELMEFRGRDALILAIPRGGVVVGFEVARALDAELDIVVPRKLGAPGNPELAIGAVMHDGATVLNWDIIEQLRISEKYIEMEKQAQLKEIRRRLSEYRGDRPYPSLEGRSCILIDDGVATGATMACAARWVKGKGSSYAIIAVPVGPPETIERLRAEADRVICPYTPEPFFAIGSFYRNFEQVSDEEVVSLLARAGMRFRP